MMMLFINDLNLTNAHLVQKDYLLVVEALVAPSYHFLLKLIVIITNTIVEVVY